MKFAIPRIILLLLFLIIAGWIFLFELQKPSKAMRELSIGSSYSELISVAGNPDYVTNGTRDVDPDFQKSDNQLVPGCTKEAWYDYPMGLLPSKYSFCFNKNNELIKKYHWSSW